MRVVVIAMVVASAPARADDPAAATLAYDRAKALADSGKWAEACPLFEKSYNADPQIGALLNLADCNEHLDRTATAWTQFRDAEELARKKHDTREGYAHGRAAALAPKLSKLVIARPAVPIVGLVVRRDGTDVTTFLGDEAAVDPGDHLLTIEAPGYVTATVSAKVEPGTVARVELPTLAKLSERESKIGIAKPATLATPPVVRRPTRSNVLPFAVGGGAVALGGIALSLELIAESTYKRAKAELSSQSQRDSLYSSANTQRHVAQTLAISGVACAGAAVWLYLRGRHARGERATASLVVAPNGIAVAGRF